MWYCSVAGTQGQDWQTSCPPVFFCQGACGEPWQWCRGPGCPPGCCCCAQGQAPASTSPDLHCSACCVDSCGSLQNICASLARSATCFHSSALCSACVVPSHCKLCLSTACLFMHSQTMPCCDTPCGRAAAFAVVCANICLAGMRLEQNAQQKSYVCTRMRAA